MSENERPQLRLIRGARSNSGVGSARVAVAAPDDLLKADALVFEEDTWLILSTGTFMPAAKEHPVRLFTQLMKAEPLLPGTVIVRQGRPVMLSAVIHDFATAPCCRQEWIDKALKEIMGICRRLRIGSVVLPLFGVIHGKMALREVIMLITRAMREPGAVYPKSILLAAPPGAAAYIRRLLSYQRRNNP